MMSFHILHVDDDDDTRGIIAFALGRDGHRVDSTASADEALQKFQPGTYDLIILDLHMPHVSGIDLFRQIKQIDPRAAVMFLSADARTPAMEEAIGESAVAYLTKPCGPDELRDAIAAFQTKSGGSR